MLLCALPKMMPCSIYLRSWILDLTSLSACECSSNRVRKPRKTGFVLPLSEVEHVFLCLQPPSWIANWGLVGLLWFFELEIGLERSSWKKLSLGNGNFNFLLQMELSMSLFFVLTQWWASSGNRTFPVYSDVNLSCMKKHGEIALAVIEKRYNHMLLWKDDFVVWLLNCFLLECYQITRRGTSSLWSLSDSSLNQHSVWIPPSAEVTQMTVVNGCG